MLRDVTTAAVRALSVLPGDIPNAIERLQAELKEGKRVLADAHSALSRYEALELAQAAEQHPWGKLVLHALDADAARLKSLASASRVAIWVPCRAAVEVVAKRCRCRPFA